MRRAAYSVELKVSKSVRLKEKTRDSGLVDKMADQMVSSKAE